MTLLSGFKNLLATSKPYDEDELTEISPIAAPVVEAALDTDNSPPNLSRSWKPPGACCR